MDTYLDLSSRERQIMEAIFRRGRATVREIREDMTDPPTAPAIRTMLSRLEDKGYLRHEQSGPRNVYSAAVPVLQARKSSLRRVMRTFFEDSPVKTVAAILDEARDDLDPDELERIARMIDRAKERGR